MAEQDTELTQTLGADGGTAPVETPEQLPETTTETPPAAGLTPEEQSAKDKAYAEAERERLRADRLEAEVTELRAKLMAPLPTTDPEYDQYADFVASKVAEDEISAYQAKQYLADKKAELAAQRKSAAEQEALRQTVIYTQAMVVGTAPQQEFKAMLADANVGGVAAVPGSELHNEIVAHFKAKGVDISNPASFVAANGQPVSPEIIQSEVLAAKLMADYRVKSRNKPRPAAQTPPLPRGAATPQAQNSSTPASFAEVSARMLAENPG